MSYAKLRHLPKNGRAIHGLHEAAAMVRAEVESHGSIDALAQKANLTTSIVARLLLDREATRNTLAQLGTAMGKVLPMPERGDLYALESIEQKWGGFEYRIKGPTGNLVGWRAGTEQEVRAYVERVIAQAKRYARGWEE